MIMGVLKDLLDSVLDLASNLKKYPRKLLSNTYYFQLKNARSPWSTCFPSSIAMLLSVVNIKVTPDEVTNTVNNTEYLEWAKLNVWHWWNFRGRVNVVWVVEKRYLEETLKSNNLDSQYSVLWNTNTNRDFIKKQIDSGIPVVINTSPWYTNAQGNRARLGHIVTIVGYNDVTNFEYVIDDPFGSMVKEYVGNVTNSNSGNDVVVNGDWFDSKVRGSLSLTLIKK